MYLDLFKFKLLVLTVCRGDIQFKADTLFDTISYSNTKKDKSVQWNNKVLRKACH